MLVGTWPAPSQHSGSQNAQSNKTYLENRGICASTRDHVGHVTGIKVETFPEKMKRSSDERAHRKLIKTYSHSQRSSSIRRA